MALYHADFECVIFTGDPAAQVSGAYIATDPYVAAHYINLSNIGLGSPIKAIAVWWTLDSEIQNASAFKFIYVGVHNAHKPVLQLQLQANPPISNRNMAIRLHLLYEDDNSAIEGLFKGRPIGEAVQVPG